ncbi:hypothetical protein Y032_0016g3026 [Ancylostoma ceylanicum]|uniref:Uncharacterized protein n=1 Tax=Ancylostoma ceylanicum TaxID=53326 RepID=A0A016V5J3_9BILA|nr:hypothetical protein Y032_0016g3026 [Ancylostoma ceylanicum]
MPVLPEELIEDVLLGEQECHGNAHAGQIPRVGVMPSSEQNDVQMAELTERVVSLGQSRDSEAQNIASAGVCARRVKSQLPTGNI